MILVASVLLRFHLILMPLLILVASFLLGCDNAQTKANVAKFSGQTMGTYWHVSIASEIAQDDYAEIEQRIEQMLLEVNQSMSTYIADSELSQFNQLPANTLYPISENLRTVMTAGLKISEMTQGYYDITVAPLVNLWGFGAKKISTKPTPEAIEQTMAQVGFEHVQLNQDGLIKDADAVQVDLSSIAKGFGVDQLAHLLESLGYSDYLVEIGGEVVASGTKFNQPWKVAIEKPAQGRQIQQVIELKGEYTALASSGNYRNFIDYEGERAVHTLDPKTGYPVLSPLLAVTVIGEDCMHADAYATALMVLGERAPEFAQTHNLLALMIFSDGKEGFEVVYSPEFIKKFGEK